MMKRDKPTLGFVTDHWSEIFEEVTLNGLPLQYATAIVVNFKNGKRWFIDVSTKNPPTSDNYVSDVLNEYKEHIDGVDIKLNTRKIKREVENAVKQLLKKIL